MCYSIHGNLQSQLKQAVFRGDSAVVKEIEKKIEEIGIPTELNLVSGFSHPKLIIETQGIKPGVEISTWGLIPSFATDLESAKMLQNKTLNARSESIFEKKSFRKIIHNQRCIIRLQGFYEYFHFGRDKYPFYISSISDESITVAGIFSSWKQNNEVEAQSSFSIVTKKAENILNIIHNNPKLIEPRTPLILDKTDEELWLSNISDPKTTTKLLNTIFKSKNKVDLKAKTVLPLSGNNSVGNTSQAIRKVSYPELAFCSELINDKISV